jgi:transcriptional regulator with XRE-family HTH domain
MEKQSMRIGQSVINALLDADISDIDISEQLNISRNSIYKWKKGKTKRIRKDNLVKLAELLNKEIVETNTGYAEFEDIEVSDVKIETNIGDITLETNRLDGSFVKNIISSLNQDKQELRDRIKDLKDTIKHKDITIESQESVIENLSGGMNIALDETKIMSVCHMEKQTYLNVTKKYADLFGYSVKEILINGKYLNFIHPDDMWKIFQLQKKINDGTETVNITDPNFKIMSMIWKMKCKDESPIHVTAEGIPIGNNLMRSTLSPTGLSGKNDKYWIEFNDNFCPDWRELQKESLKGFGAN